MITSKTKVEIVKEFLKLKRKIIILEKLNELEIKCYKAQIELMEADKERIDWLRELSDINTKLSDSTELPF